MTLARTNYSSGDAESLTKLIHEPERIKVIAEEHLLPPPGSPGNASIDSSSTSSTSATSRCSGCKECILLKHFWDCKDTLCSLCVQARLHEIGRILRIHRDVKEVTEFSRLLESKLREFRLARESLDRLPTSPSSTNGTSSTSLPPRKDPKYLRPPQEVAKRNMAKARYRKARKEYIECIGIEWMRVSQMDSDNNKRMKMAT